MSKAKKLLEQALPKKSRRSVKAAARKEQAGKAITLGARISGGRATGRIKPSDTIRGMLKRRHGLSLVATAPTQPD